ncbi:sensor histidine kinase [Aerococcaceae bacterium WGS1372]
MAVSFIAIIMILDFFNLLPVFGQSRVLSWVMPLLFSSTIGLGITGVVIKLLLNPILKLKEAMSKVIESDFSVQLDENQRIDEVNELYHSFNLMVNQLNSIQNLQKDFTSIISHEFKTPLSSIQGYVQLLQSPDLTNEEREDYQQRIIRSTRQLSALSENILKISKLDNQSFTIEKKPYRLDEQIRECILDLHNSWDKKDITMTVDLEPMTFNGNEDLLGQVWTNLLDNAIKYNHQSGQIIVKLIADTNNVIVTIEDTGVGIPSDKIPLLYERFFQVDNSRFSSGNGLGLSIVKRIIDAHKGQIDIQSEVDDGTLIEIKLPTRLETNT